MPQGEHIELHRKRYGRQLDHEERTRKKEARSVKKRSAMAQRTLGIKGKMLAKERAKEKATMRKTIAMHEERDKQHKADDGAKGSAVPAYLLEREQVRRLRGGVGACGRVRVQDGWRGALGWWDAAGRRAAAAACGTSVGPARHGCPLRRLLPDTSPSRRRRLSAPRC